MKAVRILAFLATALPAGASTYLHAVILNQNAPLEYIHLYPIFESGTVVNSVTLNIYGLPSGRGDRVNAWDWTALPVPAWLQLGQVFSVPPPTHIGLNPASGILSGGILKVGIFQRDAADFIEKSELVVDYTGAIDHIPPDPSVPEPATLGLAAAALLAGVAEKRRRRSHP